jgi:hypothetical protein
LDPRRLLFDACESQFAFHTSAISSVAILTSCSQGEVESRVLDYAKESKGTVEACVTKPGLIDAPGKMNMAMKAVSTVGRSIIGLPLVGVSEIAATLLEQAINGIEKDTLLNEDLIRIGQKALADK